MATNVAVCLSFDYDAICLWLGSLNATSPSAISRGEFGAVATERLLQMLARWDIRSTWFIPGHTIDTYPDLVRRVADAGHEIGHHNYCHENPISLSLDDEKRVLDRGTETIQRITGKAPEGFRSPAWDLSPHSLSLLLERGFLYDSSLMGHDYMPYRARSGDVITLEAPAKFGAPTRLIEMPISWSLDDHPHFEYFRTEAVTLPGLRAASGVLENWFDDFDYMTRIQDWGVITYTCHPYVIGRGHRMLMLERLIEKLRARKAAFLTMEKAAREWDAAWHPRGGKP